MAEPISFGLCAHVRDPALPCPVPDCGEGLRGGVLYLALPPHLELERRWVRERGWCWLPRDDVRMLEAAMRADPTMAWVEFL